MTKDNHPRQKLVLFRSQLDAYQAEDRDLEILDGECDIPADLNPATAKAIAAARAIHTITSATIYDPQTGAWYRVGGAIPAAEVAQAAARYLEPRLAAAATDLPKQPTQAELGLDQRYWKILTGAIGIAIASLLMAGLAVGQRSHLTTTTSPVKAARTL
jgi:hypothetical protein